MLSRLKSFIKLNFPNTTKILRKIFLPYIELKSSKYKKKRIKNFHLSASLIFTEFCDALNDANVEFWLTFGTLLGAIREKTFIAHDMDIDVAAFSDSDFDLVHKKLTEKGFVLSREIVIYTNNASEIGMEKTYTKKNVSIDIFIFHKIDDKSVYTHDFLGGVEIGNLRIYKTVRTLTLPFTGLVDYNFLNNKVSIPINYQEYLSAHYGNDYMIPNPQWTTITSPAAKIIKGAIGIVNLNNL